MYELTFALFVPSYVAQDRARAAQGGWDMRPRLFRVRLCASSPFEKAWPLFLQRYKGSIQASRKSTVASHV
jgi:hypothetical protein